MKYSDWNETNEQAVAHVGKPAVYINNALQFENDAENRVWDHVVTRFYELYPDNNTEVFNILHGGLFYFDSIEERDQFYSIFNDKPCYASAVYAVVYDGDGTCITENT